VCVINCSPAFDIRRSIKNRISINMFFPEDYFDPCPSPLVPTAILNWQTESQVRQMSIYNSHARNQKQTEPAKVLSPTSSMVDSKTWAEYLYDHKGKTIRTNDKCDRSLAPRKRAIITAKDACEIFLLTNAAEQNAHGPRHIARRAVGGDSVCVSKLFGISPKAVRDIWNR
jgi:hypothetical protein